METCKHTRIVKEIKTYYKQTSDMMICGYRNYKVDGQTDYVHGVFHYKCLDCGSIVATETVRIS